MIFYLEERVRQAGQSSVRQCEGKKIRGDRELDGRKL